MENAIVAKDLHIVYRSIQGASLFKVIFKKGTKVRQHKAVKGVTFTIHKGEIVGLIGKNGSGKSTLLKCVANIFAPDSGTLDTCGNSVSLMSIGVGFQSELPGRENIYLSGMLMGYDKAYIESKMEEIIEFSELGEYIDQPVRSYSSGMYSKLAFSISAILDADIILCDEVLSVGDVNFKKKSFAKLKELISRDDKTVIIVSHNNDTIRNLCTRVIWLHNGVLTMDGEPDKVLTAYEEFMDAQSAKEKKAMN